MKDGHLTRTIIRENNKNVNIPNSVHNSEITCIWYPQGRTIHKQANYKYLGTKMSKQKTTNKQTMKQKAKETNQS